MSVKRVPTEHSSDGFKFKILRREGKIALFHKTKPTYDAGYEVVILQLAGESYTVKGETFTREHDSLPMSRDWGVKGWSYDAADFEKADQKFDKLAKQQKRKPVDKILTR